jgi:hypothetical protein
MPVKLNFKIYQGSTFKEILRWETSTKAYKSITGITKAAPIVITAPTHGIPVGWRTKVTNVLGMKEINSSEVYHTVTESSNNSITLNAVNSLGYTDYVSGGVLEYNVPVDLTGFTARMQIRVKLDDDVVIKELTTENSGITLDVALSTIQLNITAVDTALMTFNTAVYSLELISSGGVVTPFANGTLTLVKEVTR